MYTEQEKIAKIFKALCDAKRIAIIEVLRGGEKCACELIDKLDIAQSALSYHTKILCESGIVECWYVGKWTYYKISKEGSELAQNILKELTTTNNQKIKESCCKETVV